MTSEEKKNPSLIPQGARAYNPDNLTSQGNPVYEFEYKGKKYAKGWKTNLAGMKRLGELNRLHVAENSLSYVRYLDDFPYIPISSLWLDTGLSSYTDEKIYAVQTGTKAIQRCMLMSTDPGRCV